mmetsp:Transcript_69693/g.113074  ORF Transcript_69693/g.113074 Transcript_69693/m.113074 type:complete len:288 (-) Transcript_69693:205-1068(-)
MHLSRVVRAFVPATIVEHSAATSMAGTMQEMTLKFIACHRSRSHSPHIYAKAFFLVVFPGTNIIFAIGVRQDATAMHTALKPFPQKDTTRHKFAIFIHTPSINITARALTVASIVRALVSVSCKFPVRPVSVHAEALLYAITPLTHIHIASKPAKDTITVGQICAPQSVVALASAFGRIRPNAHPTTLSLLIDVAIPPVPQLGIPHLLEVESLRPHFADERRASFRYVVLYFFPPKRFPHFWRHLWACSKPLDKAQKSTTIVLFICSTTPSFLIAIAVSTFPVLPVH